MKEKSTKRKELKNYLIKMNKKNIGKGVAVLIIATVVLAVFSGCIGEEKEIETPEATTTAPTTSTPTTPPAPITEQSEKEKIATMSELSKVIKIKAEGEVLHYQRESFWNNEEFSKLLELKEEFESKEIDSFKSTLERYNRDAVNSKIEFDRSKKTTVLICDIKDAKEGSWFDFDWLLRPYGLDFLDSNFERKEKELYWEGEIDGVETTISIKFPYPISNCHEHVWPR